MAVAIPVDGEAAILAEGRRYGRRPLAMSNQVYELNRGVQRLLDMLSALEISATFFVPGMTIERHPQLVEVIAGRGHELAHHSYSHRRPVDMTHDEQRADFERALRVFESVGIVPIGHRAASWAPTAFTLELVHEHGLLYDNSLMGHDRPYWVELPAGPVLELPAHWVMDDLEQYGFLAEPALGRTVESPATLIKIWREELDGLSLSGGLLQVTCHAYLSGRPGRSLALGRFLEDVRGRDGIEILTCEQVARRAVASQQLENRPWPPPAAQISAISTTRGAA